MVGVVVVTQMGNEVAVTPNAITGLNKNDWRTKFSKGSDESDTINTF